MGLINHNEVIRRLKTNKYDFHAKHSKFRDDLENLVAKEIEDYSFGLERFAGRKGD